jgi:hypothetical protein
MPVHSDHKYAVLYLMEAEGTKKDNIKMDLKEISLYTVFIWRRIGTSEYGNEVIEFMHGTKFVNQMREY